MLMMKIATTASRAVNPADDRPRLFKYIKLFSYLLWTQIAAQSPHCIGRYCRTNLIMSHMGRKTPSAISSTIPPTNSSNTGSSIVERVRSR